MLLIGHLSWLLFVQVLSEQYAAIRRTRGDGNCFFRSFMFAYLVCYSVDIRDALLGSAYVIFIGNSGDLQNRC